MRGAARITLVAGGLLLAAAWVIGILGLLEDRGIFAAALAETTAVFLVLLAWRYRRHRLAAVAILIAGADYLVRTGPFALPVSAGASAFAIAMGADLVALALTRDRPLFSLRGLFWPILILVEVWIAVFGIHLADPVWVDWLGHPWVRPAALIGAAAAVAGAFVFRRGAFEASLFWVAVAAAAALLGWRDAGSASLFFGACQLVLLTGFFEDSYRLAFHDQLTGLPGRRALDETMRDLGGDFAIAMADVDNFKRFNDRHGHDAGDQALRMVADELGRTDGGGTAYRYGGEEFALVYPGKTVGEIRGALEDLRRSISARKFALRGSDRPRKKPERPKKSGRPPKRVGLTVSIGVAATNPRRSTAKAVIQAADKALYRAKSAGRNRVVAAGDRLQKK